MPYNTVPSHRVDSWLRVRAAPETHAKVAMHAARSVVTVTSMGLPTHHPFRPLRTSQARCSTSGHALGSVQKLYLLCLLFSHHVPLAPLDFHSAPQCNGTSPRPSMGP